MSVKGLQIFVVPDGSYDYYIVLTEMTPLLRTSPIKQLGDCKN